jgi:NarL family two-component system sensor histidine kinase YdfH
MVKNASWVTIWVVKKSPFPQLRLSKTEATELPFFIFLTLVLLGLAIWAIIFSPGLKNPARLAPFCALMVVHIGLYWVVFFRRLSVRLILACIGAQGVLVFIISIIGQHMALVFGLYTGLIGLTVGALGKRWRLAAAAIAYLLALSLLNYVLEAGWAQISGWLLAVIPACTFTVIYVLLYSRQSEARTRALALAAALESTNRQLAEFSSRTAELTLANERQRMARELHDTLSQGLAGLILQLEAADAHLAGGRPERARAIIQQTMEQARATLAAARSAIDDLRQAPASSPDLEGLLRREMDRFTAATGVPVEVNLDLPSIQAADLSLETGLRILSEGLSNVARHAHAHQVRLRLSQSGDCLDFELRDDGVGFDPQAVADQPGHYGLLGMRERARLAGGALKVTSRPGAGTSLHLRLPIKKAEEKP